MGWDPSGLTGCLCLKVSHKAAIKMLARAAVSSEGSSEGRCFKFNHMVVGTTWFYAGFCTEGPSALLAIGWGCGGGHSLSFLMCGPLHRAVYEVTADFPESDSEERDSTLT